METPYCNSNHELIRQTLDYDFSQEKDTDYPSLDADQALKHICKFVSDICHDGVFGTVFQKSAVRREKRTA